MIPVCNVSPLYRIIETQGRLQVLMYYDLKKAKSNEKGRDNYYAEWLWNNPCYCTIVLIKKESVYNEQIYSGNYQIQLF